MEEVKQENEFASTSTQVKMDKAFYDSLVDDEKLRRTLKSIENESVQLNKYLSEEKILTSETCKLLTKIIRYLKTSIQVSPSHLQLESRPEKALLDEEGNLALFYGEGRVISKALEKCKPEIIMVVIQEVLPKLRRVIQRYGYKVQKRISLFNKVKSELKSIFKNFKAH